MRHLILVLGTLGAASSVAASAVERWNSSTADSTTHHINTGNNKVAVGAWATGSGAKAVAAHATGSNGIGVWASGAWRGVEGYGLMSGVYGYSGSGEGVIGWTQDGYGAFGFAEDEGTGVRASAAKSGPGMHATSRYGKAVYAVSQDGIGVDAVSVNGTAITATGQYQGLEVQTTNLYGNGVGISAGGRGYGLYTYGSYRGVYAWANSWDGIDNSLGVTGDAYGGDVAYGVVGYAYGGTYENWSGFFDGNVYVGGYFDNPSDQKFKTNVRDYRGGLDKILALKIKSYDMKVDEFKGKIHLPSGPQVGVIAQEAEKVFPEIVHSATAPSRLTPEERKKGVKKEDVKFKSVNYNALIPVLVQAIQELQAEVDALKAERAGAR